MELTASRLVRVTIIATFAIMLFSAQAFGHPMGNFSISHYAGIHIRPDSVELDYLIDMAEIPTFQEMQQSGMPTDSGDPQVAKYLRGRLQISRRVCSLMLDGRVLVLEPVSQQAIFPQGAGDLPTMKMGFVYRAQLP